MKSVNLKLLLVTVFSINALLAGAQGNIIIVQDSSVQRVLTLYKTFESEQRSVNGFRIQLGADNNRQELLNMKAKFMQTFPEYAAYIEYAAPQFKLRVGDFRSRASAEMFLPEIRDYFPNSFMVPDKIMVEGVDW